MYSSINIQDYVDRLTTEYDPYNKPRFLHYLKNRSSNGLSLITSEIILTDDDFDTSNSDLHQSVLEFVKRQATDDGVHVTDVTDVTDVNENNDTTIIDYHANKIATESKRGRGNFIIENEVIGYIGTNTVDNGLRIFKKDDRFAIVPIDVLGGGNISSMKQYYRKLAP
tara:strand:- start:19 stop:522 length:504 start_codon:yes stop_codon:yes gene_type:complete